MIDKQTALRSLRRALPALAAAALACALFARTLSYDLVWDDPDLMATVERAYRGGGLAGVAAAEFRLEPEKPTGYYRPVPLLSLWLDSRAGVSAAPALPFHLTNVALHALNSALVFIALALLLETAWAAAAGALLFAAHPVHVESVAFVSGRTDLWMTAFVLLATIAWLRERAGGGDGGPRRPWGWRLLGAAAFTLACLSKEAAFVLPAALLLADALRAGRGCATGWLRRNGAWVAVWSLSLLAVVLVRRYVAHVAFGAGGEAASGGAASGAAAGVLLQYLRLLVLPWPLSALYLPSDVAVTGAALLGSALLLAICTAAGVRAGARTGALALSWVLLFLLPVAGFVPIAAASLAERFLYLPSFGLALALAGALERAAVRLGPNVRLAALLPLLAFGAATLERSGVWSNEVALYQDMAKTSPRSAGARYNLGRAYRQAGRIDEAFGAFGEAVRLDPGHAKAHLNLGLIHRERGRLREGIESYETAARLDPGSPQVFYNLGNAQNDLGRLGEAAASYRRALELRPEYFEPRYRLALVYAASGDLAAARREAKVASRIDPGRAAPLLRRIEGR